MLELGRVFEPRRHRGGAARHHLVVVDVEQAQPALLTEREADHASELDELRLAEVAVQALPQRIAGVEVPGDRLGICERRLLAIVIAIRLLEVQQVLDVGLDQGACRRRLD